MEGRCDKGEKEREGRNNTEWVGVAPGLEVQEVGKIQLLQSQAKRVDWVCELAPREAGPLQGDDEASFDGSAQNARTRNRTAYVSRSKICSA